MRLTLYLLIVMSVCAVLVIVPHLAGKILFPTGQIHITENVYFSTDIFMFLSGIIYCDVTRELKNKWRRK